MTTMLTATGRLFDVKTPKAEQVRVYDIAHALSHVCRFAGQCRFHYSVAQHSVLVSQIIWERTKDERLAFAGLLHDASEAYLGDIPTPVKPLLPDYEWIELRVMQAIGEAFDMDYRDFDSSEVHTADRIALATERRDLLPEGGGMWASLQGVTPCTAVIERQSIPQSKLAFFNQFHRLAARSFV